ncbi:uncharacterized protein LOC141630726 [Silene latifolia]|uniref:uncharacterized protein LOC141630726 n=1 Tax=Silene latifolia TaxID=37657 RepID=UPI003D7818C0
MDYLGVDKIDIMALLETRVKEHKASKIIKKNFNNWNVVCNYSHHYNGWIWVLFNPRTVTVIDKTIEDQVIHFKVHHHETCLTLYLSMVYGCNDAMDRHRLWNSLAAASTSDPWFVLGDFNVVMEPSEKLSNTSPVLQDMLDFNDCLATCHLDDLTCTGCDMTWTNKKEPLSRVWSKLDRVLANPCWIISFPYSFAHFQESANAWTSTKKGSLMYCLFEKLKNVKHALTQFHKQHFSSISLKIQSAKNALVECQKHLSSNPFSAALIQKEKQLIASYSKLREIETHQQVIGAINDKYGQLHIGFFPVSNAFREYYQDFLGKSSHVTALDTDVLSAGAQVAPSDSINLLKDITTDEIRDALFGMDSNSSPGVDGFSAGFFKSVWQLIAKDFCKAVHHFFHSGHMSKQANSTVISLIPNKAIANAKSGKLLTLQWEFFANMLTGFGFPKQFTDWVLGCIQNPWYSLKLNGELSGFFQGQSGIRQGDPLSPYMFILSMEVLSRYLRKIFDQTLVSYHPKCSRLNLNHLIFADDLMIFTRGDVPSVAAVKLILNQLAGVSGLHAIIEKTKIYFGGVHPNVKEAILPGTRFSDGQFPFRYLGVPLSPSRLSMTIFDSLIPKIKHVIQHWSTHLLTYAGRVQLLSYVVLGLETFWCSCILLPQEVLKKINKLCKDFFRGIPFEGKRMVFKKWQDICLPWVAGGFNI